MINDEVEYELIVGTMNTECERWYESRFGNNTHNSVYLIIVYWHVVTYNGRHTLLYSNSTPYVGRELYNILGWT